MRYVALSDIPPFISSERQDASPCNHPDGR
jgi:hypothetical protein